MELKYVGKILSLFTVLVIISCKNDLKKEKKEIVLKSGIQKEYMDTQVKPGDDFYSYANGT